MKGIEANRLAATAAVNIRLHDVALGQLQPKRIRFSLGLSQLVFAGGNQFMSQPVANSATEKSPFDSIVLPGRNSQNFASFLAGKMSF